VNNETGSARVVALVTIGSLAVMAGWFALRTPAPRITRPETAQRSTASLPEKEAERARTLLDELPLYFIENRGQEDPRVAYYVQGRDVAVYYTADGVTFALTRPRQRNAAREGQPRRGSLELVSLGSEPDARQRWAVQLEFIGARRVTPRGQDPTSAVVSYMKGREPRWMTGLPTYAGVVYADLWPGIDLVYGGTSGRLKYTFLVRPGADPDRIRLAYRGASAVELTGAGRLRISTPVGDLGDDKPYSYQEIGGTRTEVPTAYTLLGKSSADGCGYGFRLGDYDRSRPLVLDPSFLVYAGYIGGTGEDTASAIAVDAAGNAYVAGFSTSTVPSFPGVVGPDLVQNGGTDAFVAKVKADGSGLVYAGYIGGAGLDFANAIAVDGAGSAYVVGSTQSDETTFPVKVGPDLTFNGVTDSFVAKVKPDGTGLVYAGYIGGAGIDVAKGVALDSGGNAYVVGITNSNETTFPVAVGPQLIFKGGADAFVAKVKADGSALVYAGYIGGAGSESANAVAVNSGGNAFVAGSTSSDQITFPVTIGPILTFSGPPNDAFVAKVKADGTGLVYAGYIGGSNNDEGNGIAVDTSGNAYVTGSTESDQTSFPVKVGPSLTPGGGGVRADAFVAKVKADGTGLAYAGYIGGTEPEEGNAIAVDSAGSAYVAGLAISDETTFPVKVGPGLTLNGSRAAFVSKVTADGSALLYSGYISGASSDVANGIVVDSSGNAYVAGETSSDQTSFPVTVGPDRTFNGFFDAFVVKISGKPDLLETLVGFAGANARPGGSLHISDLITNQGLGTAPASTTRYYLSLNTVKDSGDVALTGSRPVPSLIPGQFDGGNLDVTIPASTATGNYRVLACADDPHAIAELDENNNCIASLDTLVVTLPDLQETAVSNPPVNANAGQSISVTDTVRNSGLVAAGSSTTRYYLSTDTLRNAGDILLTGNRSVGALNAGDSSAGTASVTIPANAPVGSYHVLACADDTNTVKETIETNNCRSSLFAMAVAAPVGTFELSPTDATVAVGGLLVFRFEWIHTFFWRDLTTLQLRIVDETDGRIIFWVLWDQESNTFRLVDDKGKPIGRVALPGSNVTLQNADAILHLNRTTVVPGGPTSQVVTLNLAVTFKNAAARQGPRDYRVEVLATDDFGHEQGFDSAGTLRVE